MAFLFFTRMALIASSFGFFSCVTSPPPGGGGSTGTGGTVYNAGQMEKDILRFVNEYRARLGKPPLQDVSAASVQADKHSSNMASRRTAFGHDGFEARIRTISGEIGNVSAAAENVAYGNLSARQVVDGWLKSPGHKKNIEGNYNLSGIGTARDAQGVIYFTQIFLRK